MTLKVVQWSTGNVGRHAIAGIDARPELELAGVWVSNPDKDGQDAGKLAGLDRDLGVAATTDADALIALKPDCVVYTAMADNRLPDAIADLTQVPGRRHQRRLRAARCSCSTRTGTVPAEFIDPDRGGRAGRRRVAVRQRRRPGLRQRLAAARADLGRPSASTRCAAWSCSTTPTYDNPTVLFDVMGFGKPLDETPMLLQPGVLSLAWGSVVRQLAAGLDVELDELKETVVKVAGARRRSRSRPARSPRARWPRCASRCWA